MQNTVTVQEELKKLRTNQRFLAISILTLMCIFAWVSTELFSSQQETIITPEQQALVRPLQPTIEMDIFERLKQKPFYTPQDLQSFTIYKLVTVDNRSRTSEQRVVPIDADLSKLEEETITTLLPNTTDKTEDEDGSEDETTEDETTNETSSEVESQAGNNENSSNDPGTTPQQ